MNTQQILTTQVTATLGLVKPEEHQELMRPYEDQGQSMFQKLHYMGRVNPTANKTVTHTEEERFHETFDSDGGVVAPGAGNNVVVTVDAAFISNGKPYARVGDLVENQTSRAKYRVESISTDELTLKPLKTTTNAAVVDGDTWSIYSSAFAENTGQPASVVPGAIKISYTTQIIKETFGVSGTELATQIWTPYREDGASTIVWASEGLMAAEYRQMLKIDGAFLVGEEADNLGDVNTMSGLITEMEARGLDQSIATYNVAQFDVTDRYLTKQYAPKHIGIFAAAFRQQQIRQQLTDYFKDSNIQAVTKAAASALFGNDEALQATVNFSYFTNGRRTWCMGDYQGLDNPTTFNIGDEATNPYQNLALMIPMDEFKTEEGAFGSHIGIRYLSFNNQNRMMQVSTDGKQAPIPIGDIDNQLTYWLTECTGQYMKINQTVLVSAA